MNINFSNIGNRRAILTIGLYYFVMLLIALSWTNRDLVEPAKIFRYLFLFLFVLPLIKYPNYAPALITLFATIRLFSITPYGYLPSQINLYFYVTLILFFPQSIYRSSTSETNQALIALLLIVLFSNIINVVPESPELLEYNFLRLLLITIILSKLLNNSNDIILMEWSFVIITFILSISGFIFYKDFVTNTVVQHDFERFYWDDPNYLGCVLSIGMIISFHNLIDFRSFNRISIIIFLATFIFGLINLGLFASRGAFLTLAIPILYILYKKTNSFKSLSFTIIIIGILVFVFLSLFVFKSVINRFTEDSVTTGSGRTVIWRESLELFAHSDLTTLLFGGGSGFSYQICGKAFGRTIESPHNNYLEILYNYGVIGLTIFISLLIHWFKCYSKNILAVSLILVLVVSSLTLSPLMYLPFWSLIILIENQKLKQY